MSHPRIDALGVLALLVFSWTVAPDATVADAAMRSDVEAVRVLVKQGADVNEAQGDGMTALHWAGVRGSAEIAEILINAGASVDAKTRLGAYTPLHLAARRRYAPVVSVLLAAGADANAATSTGDVTPLHFAAAAGNVEVVTALLDSGADMNVAERQWGHTPLMFAAASNRVGAVRVLLQRGADPEISGSVIDMVKRNAQDRAAQKLRNQIVKCLRPEAGRGVLEVRCGVEPPPPPAPETEEPLPGRPPTGRPAEIGGYGGMTALTLAARDGSMEAAAALLAGGADLNHGTAGDGTSPILIAVMNGYFDLAMMLLERDADPRVASDAGNTPLFATINRQWIPRSRYPESTDHEQQLTTYRELMEALLKAGAEVNARLKYNVWHIERGGSLQGVDWIGATPFIRAAHGADVEAMKLLVQYGADPTTPTLRPIQRREAELERGAIAAPEHDPSGLPPVPDEGPGIYPIHMATGYAHGYGFASNIHRHVGNGFLPAVRYLVELHSADVSARDHKGDTPLHNAAARGDNELILYLVGKGADPTAVNRNGQTTVDMANGPYQRTQPYPETIRLLESLGVKNNHNCVTC